MQEVLPEGAVIRKLWIGESDQIPRTSAAPRPGKPPQPVRRRRVRRIHPQLRRSVGGARRRGARLLRRRRDPRRRRVAAARATIRRVRPKRRSASRSRGRAMASARRCFGARCSTARNRGFRVLHMACLAENHRMQQLARKFDAELTFDFGSVVGEVESRARRRCR